MINSWLPYLLGAVTGLLAAWPLWWLFTRSKQYFRRQRAIDAERRLLEELREEDRRHSSSEFTVQVLPSRAPVLPPSTPYYHYLTDLRLENLRCFSEARVEFRYPGEGRQLKYPNVNLLLGDNGAGKSTVLRAAAMAAIAPVLDASGFVPYKLVRHGMDQALIEASFATRVGHEGEAALASTVAVQRRGDLEILKTQTRGAYWQDIFNESRPSFFVVGYGVNRRTAEEARSDPSLERGRRRRRYQRVSSLFDDTVSLMPVGAWLQTLDKARSTEATELFERLLPDEARFTRHFEGEDPVFLRRGVPVPFRALSDGYRSYIGWLSDLLFHVAAVAPREVRLTDVGGLVLVDEVDLLLHPRWQRTVIPTVSEVFPQIQFFFTTHSPLVTGTLQAENITVSEEGEQPGSSAVRKIGAEVHGLSAEQVLLSSYFDLRSTRAPDAAADLESLALQAVAGDDEARRRYLRALAEGPPAGMQ